MNVFRNRALVADGGTDQAEPPASDGRGREGWVPVPVEEGKGQTVVAFWGSSNCLE